MSIQKPPPKAITVAARFAHLAQLRDWLTTVWGDAPAAALPRATLAIEELFANTIHHGYEGESDQPVWLTAEGLPNGMRLHYADAAPPFDPLAVALEHDIEGDLATRRVGGLGRVLIREMAQASSYRYAAGRNETTLDYLSGPPSDSARPS